MTGAALNSMRSAVAAGAASLERGDIPGLFRASEVFRNARLEIVPNTAMVETIRHYFTQVQKVRLPTMRHPPTLHVTIDGQTDLLAAFENRDSVAAADRMLAFVIAGEQAFRKMVPTAHS